MVRWKVNIILRKDHSLNIFPACVFYDSKARFWFPSLVVCSCKWYQYTAVQVESGSKKQKTKQKTPGLVATAMYCCNLTAH